QWGSQKLRPLRPRLVNDPVESGAFLGRRKAAMPPARLSLTLDESPFDQGVDRSRGLTVVAAEHADKSAPVSGRIIGNLREHPGFEVGKAGHPFECKCTAARKIRHQGHQWRDDELALRSRPFPVAAI